MKIKCTNMALYIHSENQQLLWKIANKNPMVQEYFAAYPVNIQENWFKQIVSSFYEQNRNNISSAEDLYEINKNTLTYMVQDVKRNVQYREERGRNQDQRSQDQRSQDQRNQDQRSQDQRSQDQRSQDQRSQDQRSQDQRSQDQRSQDQRGPTTIDTQYHSMFDKKVPESIDFREKNDDVPLTGNMEDLVKKHLRERDEELLRYTPAPFFGAKVEPSRSNRLTISENIQLHIDDEIGGNLDELRSVRVTPVGGDSHLERRSRSEGGFPLSRSSVREGSTFSETERDEGFADSEKNVLSDQESPPKDTTIKWLDNENSDKIQQLEQELLRYKTENSELILEMKRHMLLLQSRVDQFTSSPVRGRDGMNGIPKPQQLTTENTEGGDLRSFTEGVHSNLENTFVLPSTLEEESVKITSRPYVVAP